MPVHASQSEQPSLKELLTERVLLLDGSMGVMLQQYSPKGNCDMLNLTNPETVASVHRQYLEAGSDIIETNTFNGTVLAQREYGTEQLTREINLAGARIARREADRFSNSDKPRFVAGTMGPTGIAASRVANPDVVCKEMSEAFAGQAEALIEGGVDFLLIETIYDALSAEAAAIGVRRAFERHDIEIPIVFSLTFSDRLGRLLSGHTLEEFLSIVQNYNPLAVGLNCSDGPETSGMLLRKIAEVSPYATIFYPNAGRPDKLGRYPVTPGQFADYVTPLLDAGLINIAGGCCGTTPAHIALLAKAIHENSKSRKPYNFGL